MYNKQLRSCLLLVFILLAFASISKNTNLPLRVSNKTLPGKGIQFIEANWQEALIQARQQNKLIFLDAYASWCGPCKLLKKETFPDAEAGEFFNQYFINVAVNMEKGYGPALAEKYKVDAYPTLLITDANGNLLTYTKGFMQPKQLISFGQYGLAQKRKMK